MEEEFPIKARTQYGDERGEVSLDFEVGLIRGLAEFVGVDMDAYDVISFSLYAGEHNFEDWTVQLYAKRKQDEPQDGVLEVKHFDKTLNFREIQKFIKRLDIAFNMPYTNIQKIVYQ